MSIENFSFSPNGTRMIENERDLVTLKIRPADKEWAEAEQGRLKRAEKRKITQAVFFSRLRNTYTAARKEPTGEALVLPRENPYDLSRSEVEWLTLIRAADRAAHDKLWRDAISVAKRLLQRAANSGSDTAEE